MMTNEEKFLVICITGVVILAIIGVTIKILEIIQLRETKRLKHEMEEAFFDSGIATKLGDEFQSLFGRRDIYRSFPCSRQLAVNFYDFERHLNYLQKYFGLTVNDETLFHLKKCTELLTKLDELVVSNPEWEQFGNTLYPKFTMYYQSSTGRSSFSTDYVFNSQTIGVLYSQVEEFLYKRSSRKIQRSLMTPELRQQILRRDNWTCQQCGNSIYREPNLLLEVDHIIPISKGGKTVPSNLQTLCWKCNRSKSDNIQMPFVRNFREDKANQAVCFPDEINL